MSESVRNPTPWSSSLAERLQLLKQGTTRVAYFSELPDQASFRYRCYNMAQALNSYSSTHSGSYFYLSDLHGLDNLSDASDVLVLSRVRYDGQVHRLIDQFKRAGKPVLSDMDDLVFSPRYAGLVARSLDHPTEGKVIDSWFAFLSRVGETLRLSDAVIVSTEHLAALVMQETTHSVAVVPNFLNEEQLTVSLAARASQEFFDKAVIRLGYFSGSNSHSLDFKIVAPALRQLLQRYDNLKVVLAGHVDVPPELADVSDQIEWLPYMDILSLQEAIAGVDWNIVALQANDFTFSKSELKFFEAAIVETPTIATATPVFAAAIEDGVNGFLVSDEDWLESLERAVALTPRRYKAMARAARATAERSFTAKTLTLTIERALRVS
jgi:glycosyltransferase involved in cell wall biosynthesis